MRSMADHVFAERQRLAFGQVAELYHRARPDLPAVAIDAVIEAAPLKPSSAIFEAGAGTGKATVQFAQRGLDILGIEPSPEMVRVARTTCAEYASVQIVEVDFESWRPHERRTALISVQAWHWIDSALRYRRAHEALLENGLLAAVWTFPDWRECSLRGQLSKAYSQAAPQMVTDFPMHPDSEPAALAGDWHAEIAGGGCFKGPRVRTFPWVQRYSATAYTSLLQTHQDHILLAARQRANLLDAIAAAIDAHGGTFAMPFVTHVCTATRV